MFDNPSKKSFAPRLGARVEPARRQEDDRQGRLRALLPAADDVVLPRHDVPHLPVLRGRRHPAADRVRAGQHRRARSGRQSRARCRSGRSSSSTTSSSPTCSSGTSTSSAISDTTSSARSATSDRRATTCRSTAIPTRRRRVTARTASSGWCPARPLRYPSWGRIRTRINIARSNYHGMTLEPEQALLRRLAVAGVVHARRLEGHLVGRPDRRLRLRQRRGQRERLVGSGVRVRTVELRRPPQLRDQRRLRAAVWRGVDRRRRRASSKGWQVGGVMQFASGLPFTPFLGYDQVGDRQSDTGLHKPNVNGAVNYPKTAEQWFDPSVFTRTRRRRVRQRDAQLAARGRDSRSPTSPLFKNFHVRALSGAVPARGVQRVQLGELRIARRHDLQRGRRAQSDGGTHPQHVDAGAADSARVQVHLLTSHQPPATSLQFLSSCQLAAGS